MLGDRDRLRETNQSLPLRVLAAVAASVAIAIVAAACSSSSKPSATATARVAATATPGRTAAATAGVTAIASAATSPTAASGLTLTSSAFADGGTIPAQYTCSGAQTSPPLSWTGAPAGTSAFTLIVDDPDAPLPGGFTHWVVFDLSPDTTALPEGVTLPPQAVSGKNGAGTQEYLGPCPPAGAPHHYRFHLYALDTPLNLPPGSSKSEVIAAMNGHILGESLLTGLFSR
ncbi:MAG: YbhB/YbcL family Raf kinase inhibitor-like protein [Chloroflexota bacterium]|nr:YbhB/YbcL family Raf kinase inhibitor-like protein [Chloroflexota bacterium]